MLADLYAFGAATSYSFVFVALIALRLKDPLSPRKFRIPLNFPVRFRGERADFPIVGVIGFAGIFSILIFTMLTHPIGRIAGPSWLIAGVVGLLRLPEAQGAAGLRLAARSTGRRSRSASSRMPASWS